MALQAIALPAELSYLLICINIDSLKGVQIFERQIIMQIKHGLNINGLFSADGH